MPVLVLRPPQPCPRERAVHEPCFPSPARRGPPSWRETAQEWGGQVALEQSCCRGVSRFIVQSSGVTVRAAWNLASRLGPLGRGRAEQCDKCHQHRLFRGRGRVTEQMTREKAELPATLSPLLPTGTPPLPLHPVPRTDMVSSTCGRTVWPQESLTAHLPPPRSSDQGLVSARGRLAAVATAVEVTEGKSGVQGGLEGVEGFLGPTVTCTDARGRGLPELPFLWGRWGECMWSPHSQKRRHGGVWAAGGPGGRRGCWAEAPPEAPWSWEAATGCHLGRGLGIHLTVSPAPGGHSQGLLWPERLLAVSHDLFIYYF